MLDFLEWRGFRLFKDVGVEEKNNDTAAWSLIVYQLYFVHNESKLNTTKITLVCSFGITRFTEFAVQGTEVNLKMLENRVKKSSWSLLSLGTRSLNCFRF